MVKLEESTLREIQSDPSVQFVGELLDAVERRYNQLSRGLPSKARNYGDKISLAFALCGAQAIRSLRAGQAAVHAGFALHSLPNTRAASLAVIDMAYIWSFSTAKERASHAVMCVEVAVMREPDLRALFEGEPCWHPKLEIALTPEQDHLRRKYEQLSKDAIKNNENKLQKARKKKESLPEVKRLNPREHWSGLTEAQVRKIASPVLETKFLGQSEAPDAKAMAEAKLVDFNFPSKVAHADLSVLPMIPWEGTRPIVSPHAKGADEFARYLAYWALLLLGGFATMLGSAARAERDTLSTRLYELSPADDQST